MKELDEILESLKSKITSINNINDLNNLKAEYLGKKGSISALSSKLGELSIEEKKSFGMELNKLKNAANELLDNKRLEIENAILNEKLAKESIDIRGKSRDNQSCAKGKRNGIVYNRNGL